VMIATDVAARGLDIEKVGLVVNYDFPDTIDSYVHRIGRTGRIGNKGRAITFIACDDDSELTIENSDVLKQLLGIMKDAGAEIPHWLEPLVERSIEAKGSYSKWGGK
ncbi:unnamed protein product, partial [Prorocentrum cordatum]